MKGLIIKDIVNLRKQLLVIVMLYGFYLIMALNGGDGAFFAGATSVFVAILPISTMSYDEYCNWDKYALSMPLSRSDLVISKYLMAGIFSTANFLVTLFINYIFVKDMWLSTVTSVAFFGVSMMAVSVLLPIMFKFGVEHGRTIMMVIFLVPTILFFGLSKLGTPTLPTEIVDFTMKYAVVISIAFALLVIAISVKISINIVNKKDYN